LKKTEVFTLGQVLSVSTGKLLCGMAGLYEIMNFLTGENLLTHQLVRAFAPCKKYALEQFPNLEEVDTSCVNTENALSWVEEQKELFGELFALTPMPPGYYSPMDPMEELCTMVPKEKIIVVSPEKMNLITDAKDERLKEKMEPEYMRVLKLSLHSILVTLQTTRETLYDSERNNKRNCDYLRALIAERDALQAQLCKVRETVTVACERLETLSNQKEIIYGTNVYKIRDLLYSASTLFAGEHRPDLFCSHASELTRLAKEEK